MQVTHLFPGHVPGARRVRGPFKLSDSGPGQDPLIEDPEGAAFKEKFPSNTRLRGAISPPPSGEQKSSQMHASKINSARERSGASCLRSQAV